ncbi:MAG: GIY-YIG nuclease family protein [Gemmatimonadaceae bacterium]
MTHGVIHRRTCRMREFSVYILASRSRCLYVGVTNDLRRRVAEHRSSSEGFTARYRIHRLMHFEPTSNVRSAIAHEKEIKGWRRSKKLALIETSNPTWQDLAEEWSGEHCPFSSRSFAPAGLRMTLALRSSG